MLRTPCSLLICLCATASNASAQRFDYPDFTNISGLALNGAAFQLSWHLRLTSHAVSEKGSVWYDQAVDVAGGFDTTFEFVITDLGGIGGGEGLAFVIQNDPSGPSALGDHGSALGYGGFLTSPTNALDNSLAIELDTFLDASWGDPDSNHISIHTGGTGDNSQHEDFSIGRVSPVPLFSLGGTSHTVRIRYVPGQLDVFFGDLSTPVLSAAYHFNTGGIYVDNQQPVGGLDLMDCRRAFVGFTASTGAAIENHDLLSWEFTSTSLGTNYCLASPNSTGSPAGISASGSTGVAANDLQLRSCPVPNQPGLFFYGPNRIQMPFGDGFRCVGGTVGRLDVISPVGSVFSFLVDNTMPPSPATQITAGSTWNFQNWYRDPAAGGAFFNLSDGLELSFTP